MKYATKHGTIFDGGGNAVVVFNFSTRHKNIGAKCLKAIILKKNKGSKFGGRTN